MKIIFLNSVAASNPPIYWSGIAIEQSVARSPFPFTCSNFIQIIPNPTDLGNNIKFFTLHLPKKKKTAPNLHLQITFFSEDFSRLQGLGGREAIAPQGRGGQRLAVQRLAFDRGVAGLGQGRLGGLLGFLGLVQLKVEVGQDPERLA